MSGVDEGCSAGCVHGQVFLRRRNGLIWDSSGAHTSTREPSLPVLLHTLHVLCALSQLVVLVSDAQAAPSGCQGGRETWMSSCGAAAGTAPTHGCKHGMPSSSRLLALPLTARRDCVQGRGRSSTRQWPPRFPPPSPGGSCILQLCPQAGPAGEAAVQKGGSCAVVHCKRSKMLKAAVDRMGGWQHRRERRAGKVTGYAHAIAG